MLSWRIYLNIIIIPKLRGRRPNKALRGRQGLWSNRVLLAAQTEALEPIRL